MKGIMAIMFRWFIFLLLILCAATIACGLPLSSVSTPVHDKPTSATPAAATPRDATETPVAQTVVPTHQPATETPVPSTPGIDPSAIPASALRVAFIDTNRNLSIWAEGTGVIALTHSGDVAALRLSPDGDQVAFVRATTDQLDASVWVIHWNGSGERQLLSQEDLRALAPVKDSIGIMPLQFEWIPGTSSLALGTYPRFEGSGLMLNEDLIIVNLASGMHFSLLAPGKGGRFYYSPDGSQIALVKPDRIDLVNADGSNRRDAVLTYPMVSTYSEYAFYPTPVWSPDGASLAVTIPPAEALGNPLEPTYIWRIPVEDGTAAELGSVLTAPLMWPLISPDVQHLLYLAPAPGSPGPLNLYTAAVDGRGAELYTNNGGRISAWAPDSTRFAFYEHNAFSPLLGTIDAKAVPLTSVSSVDFLLFARGGRVVFLTRNDRTWEVRFCQPPSSSELIASFPAGDNLPQIDTMR